MLRLIDADDLLKTIEKKTYPVRYDFGFGSEEFGMTITGIKQVLCEIPTADPFRDISGLEERLRNIRGIGSAKAALIMNEIKTCLRGGESEDQ